MSFRTLLLLSWLLIVSGTHCHGWQLDTGVSSCIPALVKDYYAVPHSRGLDIEFLNVIDYSCWSEFKSTFGSLFEIWKIPLSDTYEEFDLKRNSYLTQLYYDRSVSEAQEIIESVAGTLTYPRYEACLREAKSGSPIRVWAAYETPEQIEIWIKYVNPGNVASKGLTGTVIRGKVAGSPTGQLWRGIRRWGTMEERGFLVHREPGAVATTIIVRVVERSSPPITVTFIERSQQK